MQAAPTIYEQLSRELKRRCRRAGAENHQKRGRCIMNAHIPQATSSAKAGAHFESRGSAAEHAVTFRRKSHDDV
eukprot:4501313-Pleurochrysis_carterae.AAC.1